MHQKNHSQKFHCKANSNPDIKKEELIGELERECEESNKNRKHKWMKENHEWERKPASKLFASLFYCELGIRIRKVYLNHSCACARLCGMCTFYLCDFTKCFSFPFPFIIFVFDSCFFSSFCQSSSFFIQFMLLISRSTFCFYENSVINMGLCKHSNKFKAIISKVTLIIVII